MLVTFVGRFTSLQINRISGNLFERQKLLREALLTSGGTLGFHVTVVRKP